MPVNAGVAGVRVEKSDLTEMLYEISIDGQNLANASEKPIILVMRLERAKDRFIPR